VTVVRGPNNQALDSDLAIISTRGFVLTGNEVMIRGFTLGGNTNPTRVAVRGLGPSLSQSGLSNVLVDPTLELHNANGTIMIRRVLFLASQHPDLSVVSRCDRCARPK
jgi:hypothetical protein